MEFTIGATTEAFHIIGVCYPIRGTHIAIQRHIVYVFINIQKVANLLISITGLCPCQSRRQIHQLKPRLIIAYLLIILGIAQIKLIHIIKVNTIVAVSIVFVVTFTDIKHTVIISVQEDMCRLIVLTIYIESARQHNRLKNGILCS